MGNDLDIRLPEVLEARCVHTRLEQAGCRSCVQACPRRAWVIDEEMLGIDPDRCDGCDLCVPACPQGAIRPHFSPALKQTEKGVMAFALCEHAGVPGIRDALMPCVHAIGLRDVIKLQRLGVTYLIAACGNCDDCERGGAERLMRTFTAANRLLSLRGARIIHYRNMSPEKWLRVLDKVNRTAPRRTLSRRALFRGALRDPLERLQAAMQSEEREFRAAGELLPDSQVDAPLPFVPVIDPVRCNGCDACTRLCPQQALMLEDDGSAYRIKAARCTGCAVCLDVCEPKAIQIKCLGSVRQDHIALQSKRCGACGVRYHIPLQDTELRCRVCRRTNHHSRLFQVLAPSVDSGEC